VIRDAAASDRLLAVVAAASLCALAVAGWGECVAAQADGHPAGRHLRDHYLADPLAAFRHPGAVPVPAGAVTGPQAVALGRLLFHDTRLSGDGSRSCASCHDETLGFADGLARQVGLDGKPLPRHTPHLWNLAWAPLLFWDGRAGSLEEQATGPIENPREMNGDLTAIAARLATDPAMRTAFAEVFPASPAPSRETIAKALAAYERTLTSPPTRFDRWVTGDATALDADEQAGFALFTGKAGCASCHSGWRFTDDSFHDIGLPDGDEGRAGIAAGPLARHAFKTPSLRELTWTAPYMHDGSIADLESVIDHYAGGLVERPGVSREIRKGLLLDAAERTQLLAFLATLSSEDAPRPPSEPPRVEMIGTAVPTRTHHVSQADKAFAPGAVRLHAGEGLTIVNDDNRTHNIRVEDPRLPALSLAQEPGDSVVVAFPDAGDFTVTCGIHPSMRLSVQVEPSQTMPIGGGNPHR
jgi:cytochrome c peroxidase